jgi:hypothetical protein
MIDAKACRIPLPRKGEHRLQRPRGGRGEGEAQARANSRLGEGDDTPLGTAERTPYTPEGIGSALVTVDAHSGVDDARIAETPCGFSIDVYAVVERATRRPSAPSLVEDRPESGMEQRLASERSKTGTPSAASFIQKAPLFLRRQLTPILRCGVTVTAAEITPGREVPHHHGSPG